MSNTSLYRYYASILYRAREYFTPGQKKYTIYKNTYDI